MNVSEFESNFGKQEHHEYSDYWIVYFLVNASSEIVYVGKTSSTRLGGRLRQHRTTKQFSSYFTKAGPQTEQEAYDLEGAFISMIRPKYNRANRSIAVKEMRYLCDWISSPTTKGAIPDKAPLWLILFFWVTIASIGTGYLFFLGSAIFFTWFGVTNAALVFWLLVSLFTIAIIKNFGWERANPVINA